MFLSELTFYYSPANTAEDFLCLKFCVMAVVGLL